MSVSLSVCVSLSLWELGNPHGTGSLFDQIAETVETEVSAGARFVTMGTEVIIGANYWLTTATTGHIVAKIILNIIIINIIIFHHEFRPGWPVPVSALISSSSLLSGLPGRRLPFG
jgi:uncharacterized membrane protein